MNISNFSLSFVANTSSSKRIAIGFFFTGNSQASKD